jgi:tyrosine-protein phosphatase YwqE
MQMSGTCPPLSDGSRKTVTTKAPAKAAVTRAIAKPVAASGHKRGGYAKHAKGGK